MFDTLLKKASTVEILYRNEWNKNDVNVVGVSTL